MGEIPPLGRNRSHKGQWGGARGGGIKPAYGPNHSRPSNDEGCGFLALGLLVAAGGVVAAVSAGVYGVARAVLG